MRRTIKEQLIAYEQQFGMSSEEFMRQWDEGAMDTSWEFNHWASLVRRHEKMWNEIDAFFNAPDPIPPLSDEAYKEVWNGAMGYSEAVPLLSEADYWRSMYADDD